MTIAPERAQAQQTVTVSTTAMTSDGDTSSVSALLANPGPDGKISFAEALTAVNATGPGNTIAFALPHGSAIQTGTTLYILTAPNTTIDGDVDGDGLPDVAIYAVPAGQFWVPLSVRADHVTIRNLSIAGLSVYGDSAHDCMVTGCYLGVNVDGKTRLPVFGGGVEVRQGAYHNTVTDCIASGNTGGPGGQLGTGIFLFDGAHDNTVQRCRVGVDIDGNPVPNDIGLEVGTNTGAAPNNLIGGTRSASGNPGNVVSGNTYNGLEVIGPGTNGNTVQGNIVGLDPTGTKAAPNGTATGSTAFFVGRGAENNTIGGDRLTPDYGGGNLISGNAGAGLGLRYDGTTGNVITGNLVGTDITGKILIGNRGDGILFLDGVEDCVVGTAFGKPIAPLASNLIAGNGGAGVKVSGTAHYITIRGNEIRDNKALGIDLAANDRAAGDHVTPNDPDDKDAGPNELMNFPVGITAWYNPATDRTVISGVLPNPFAGIDTVDVYLNTKRDPSGFGQGELYLASSTPDPSGVFLIAGPGRLPAAYPYISATATDSNGNTSEFSYVLSDPDGDGNFDDDGDGLPDEWETGGIDYDGDGTVDLDLNALGANFRHKDVFVEVDWMEDSTHTHRPDMRPDKTALPANPLDRVVAAFANAPVHNPDGVDGVTLHLNLDEAVPEVPVIAFDFNGPGTLDDFNDIKDGNPASPTNGYFGTAADRVSSNAANIIGAKKLVYRYCIFGHSFAECRDCSGVGEIGGNDFFVALRTHTAGSKADFETDANTVAAKWKTSFDVEWSDVVAASFMHELGHTLGLQHGGGQGIPVSQAANREINCKPNYLSVMNYSIAFNEAGKAESLPGIKDGTLVRTNRPLDYSRAALPPLVEDHLDEPAGIGGPTGQRTLYGYFGARRVGPADGPIDWNDSGIPTDTNLPEDVNFIRDDPLCPASAGQTLLSHDDWSNLLYTFRTILDFGDGHPRTSLPPTEPTDEDYLKGCLGGLPQDNAFDIAAGFARATADDLASWNVVDTGPSAGRIDLLDVVRLAREAAGLDP